MLKISAKDVPRYFGALLNSVEQGNQIAIQRRGKTIAYLVPPERAAKRLPSLAKFRASIKAKGLPLSAMVYKQRDESY